MKKRFVLTLLTVFAIVFLAFVPALVKGYIPSAYYIRPIARSVDNTITCSGIIQSESIREIYLQSPSITNELYVTVGDIVGKGEVLAVITANSGMLSQIVSVPEDYANITSISDDWIALASMYGLSAELLQDVDNQQVESFLGQNMELVSGLPLAGITQPPAEPEEILAPISGIIIEVNAAEETMTSSAKPYVTIADPDHYKVVVSVGEAEIGKIRLGDEAAVRGIGFSGEYAAVVSKIYPVAKKLSAGSGAVVDVELKILNSDRDLKSGFSADVEILSAGEQDSLALPYEAIRQDDEGEFVYVYLDGRVQRQYIVTGREMADSVEVSEGLEPEAVVVFNPESVSKEGSVVQIKGYADVD